MSKILKYSKKLRIIIFSLFSAVFVFGCANIGNVMNTLTNLDKIQFKLGKVSGFAVNNVNLSGVKSISDFSITDGLRLTQAFANKSLPTSFNLELIAHNPNAKPSNSKSSFDAIIKSIDWVLLINDKETINGSVNSPVTVPSASKNTIIPLSIGLDLYSFFGEKGYNEIINLALALGGVNGSSSNLKLKLKPVVSIAGIQIPYSGYITAIDKEFRG
jgi:hypothetical protein